MLVSGNWEEVHFRINSIIRTCHALYQQNDGTVTIGYQTYNGHIRIYIFKYVHDMLDFTHEDDLEVQEIISNFPVPLDRKCPVMLFKAENGKRIILYIGRDYLCKILNGNVFMAENIPELINAYEYDVEQARRFAPSLVEKIEY